MYELIQAAGRSHYFQCPAKIGLVRLEGADVCLIDAGSDKDAGRKVRQQLDANGWRLAAIYATHSHADHIGGAKYLQSQTGCPVYAPGIERAFTCHTVSPVGTCGTNSSWPSPARPGSSRPRICPRAWRPSPCPATAST